MIDHVALARRVDRVLFVSYALSSGAIIAGNTIVTIAGASLSGHAAWAGFPSAVFFAGAAFAALGWGYVMDSIGRRWMLTLALLSGIAGAAIAATALYIRSFPLFLAAQVPMGAAFAAAQLSRFVAAEVHLPSMRGRAIANVVLAGAIGAVVGPLLVGPTGKVALSLSLNELSGPYAAASVIFALSAIVAWLGLRPDPRDIARELASANPGVGAGAAPARPLGQILQQPPVIIAMAAVVLGQIVMIMLMVIVGLHMRIHSQSLTAISFVLSSHTFGMFAFSILSGRLVDRLGRIPIILFGGSLMILAALLAPVAHGVPALAGTLFLLGFGWNLNFVGASTLLSDQLAQSERARVQGFNDLLISMASAVGSLGSGVIYAAVGFTTLGAIAAGVTLVPLLGIGLYQRSHRKLLPAES